MRRKRVQFDFEADFTNGGGFQGQGFRPTALPPRISGVGTLPVRAIATLG